MGVLRIRGCGFGNRHTLKLRASFGICFLGMFWEVVVVVRRQGVAPCQTVTEISQIAMDLSKTGSVTKQPTAARPFFLSISRLALSSTSSARCLSEVNSLSQKTNNIGNLPKNTNKLSTRKSIYYSPGSPRARVFCAALSTWYLPA